MTYKLDISLLHRIRLAAQFLESEFANSITDITFRQFVVLEAVEMSEGASQTGLVAKTGIDRSTIADIIRRLQRHGFISRRRNRSDARAYQVHLTLRGREVLMRGRETALQTEVLAARLLGKEQQRALLDLLTRLARPAGATQSTFPVALS